MHSERLAFIVGEGQFRLYERLSSLVFGCWLNRHNPAHFAFKDRPVTVRPVLVYNDLLTDKEC